MELEAHKNLLKFTALLGISLTLLSGIVMRLSSDSSATLEQQIAEGTSRRLGTQVINDMLQWVARRSNQSLQAGSYPINVTHSDTDHSNFNRMVITNPEDPAQIAELDRMAGLPGTVLISWNDYCLDEGNGMEQVFGLYWYGPDGDKPVSVLTDSVYSNTNYGGINVEPNFTQFGREGGTVTYELHGSDIPERRQGYFTSIGSGNSERITRDAFITAVGDCLSTLPRE